MSSPAFHLGFAVPPYLYKTPPTSDGTPTDTKSSVHYISGRYPDNASIQGGVAASGAADSTSAGILVLYYQRRQITAGSVPGDSIPGVSSGCQTNEVLPSRGENTRHCSGLSGDPGPGKVVNSTTVTTFGQVERGLPSSSVSPSMLQQLKIQSLKRSRSFDTLVTLDQRAVEELLWWKDQLRNWNGRDIVPPPPDMVIETDASNIGWGAVC